MSRDLIALGAVLLLIVGVALVFYPIYSSSNQANPTVITETPAPHFPKSPRPTSKPTTKSSTIKETTTTLGEEIYHDILRGGTFESGDKVEFSEVKGIIQNGKISNGKVLSSLVHLIDEQSQTILGYLQQDNAKYGHLELISKPQEGDVIMKQNGKQLDNCLKYHPGYNFNTYVDIVFAPHELNPKVVEKLTC